MRLAKIVLLMGPLALGCGDNDDDEQPNASDDVRVEGTEPGDCSDEADNDLDGLFDCADDGCADAEECGDAETNANADADTGSAGTTGSAADTGESEPEGEDSAADTDVPAAEGEDSAADTGDASADTGEPPPPVEPIPPVFERDVTAFPPDGVIAEASPHTSLFPTPADWDGDGDKDIVIVNGWTGSIAVSYQTDHRTFSEPVAEPETAVDFAISALTAVHDDLFTSDYISVVRSVPYQYEADGPEGVLVQLQARRGASGWGGESHDPVVLMTAEGGVLMSPNPTNGFRKLADLNGDGIDEVLVAEGETGADIVWSGDPSVRTPVPMEILITLKFPLSGQVAVTSPETGEFIFIPGGMYSEPEDTIYHLQATEEAVTVVATEPVGFGPEIVLANPDHPSPQPLFTTRYDQPITRFVGDTRTAVMSDSGEAHMGNPTRYAQLDGIAGYDLIELGSVQRAWMATEDAGWLAFDVPSAEFSGDGEHDPGLFVQDLDADGKAELISATSGEGDTYFQKIWWNITE